MIARGPKTKLSAITVGAALLCLAASFPAAAASPTVGPLTISIAPILPLGGVQAPQDRHFSRLDNGIDDLQEALFNAWQRRTDRQLSVVMPKEDVSLAAAETSKTNEIQLQAVAQYIVKVTYQKLGNSAQATAKLYRRSTSVTVDTVKDQIDDPDAANPFAGLGEKLADALAAAEKIKITTHRLVFCTFAFSGESQSSERIPVSLREDILQYFGRVTAHRMPILEEAPSDCTQLARGAGHRATGDGGSVTVYVFGTISFLPDRIIVKIISAGEIVAEQQCRQEQELQQKETIESLIRDLWSHLNAQLMRQRRES